MRELWAVQLVVSVCNVYDWQAEKGTDHTDLQPIAELLFGHLPRHLVISVLFLLLAAHSSESVLVPVDYPVLQFRPGPLPTGSLLSLLFLFQKL